ncbi:MAG: Ig-like domain-containing protein [Arenicella sp.]
MLRIVVSLIVLLSFVPIQASQAGVTEKILPVIKLLLLDEGGAVSSTPPQLSFVRPNANQEFTVGSDIRVEVTATDDGGVDRVELYIDGANTPVRTERNPPYTWNDTGQGAADPVLSQLAVGLHQLRVVAYDNDGLSAQLIRTISVVAGNVPEPPTVAFNTPADNQAFDEGQDVFVSVTASDDSAVEKVELYVDDTLLNADSSQPYEWNVTGLLQGQHILRAVVFDDEGLTAQAVRTISVRAVVVEIPPTVSFSTPNANEIFTEGNRVNVVVAASDADGSIQRVDLYVDDLLQGSDSSSPFVWNLDDLGLGQHSLQAVAVDDDDLEAQTTISITVEEDIVIPPGNGLKAGRAVKNVLRTPAVGVSLSTSNHNDFSHWEVVTESNASVAVAADGESVTFTRNVPGDGSNARAYIEFPVGALWPDDDVSFCFEVSGYTETASGVRGASLEIVNSGLTGTKSRTVTQNGIYCTVVSLTEKLAITPVRLGLGVMTNDTRTNALTISRFSVSPTQDSLPNEFVKVDQRRQTVSRSGISGASFNFPKSVSYDAATGLTSFVVPSTTDDSPSASHVLAITDSFGTFLSFGVWAPFYGFDDSNTTPNYVVTMNNQSGRALADTNPDANALLDNMLAEALARNSNDGAPGICWLAQGVNDIHLEENSAAITFAHLQAHIDWCTEHGMYPVLVTAGPFNGFETSWTQAKENQRNAYNAQVRSLVENSSGQIAIVDYDLLLDGDRDGVLDDVYDLDGLHPNKAGAAVLSAEADDVFNRIIDSVSGGGNQPINAVINPSRTDCASPCTVVFSADKTTAQGLDGHGIWSQLSYYWDFDTDETDTYGSLYSQTYSYVDGDTAHEKGHVPMVTKTFLCETQVCSYQVGLRARNSAGDYDDAFVTITVRSEAAQWSAADTLCVSNTLSMASNWSSFDKPCPAGASRRTSLPLPDQLDGKLVLLKRGDVFSDSDLVTSIKPPRDGKPAVKTNKWYVQIGQSDFKVTHFGDEADAYPFINGIVDTNLASFSPSNAASQADMDSIDTLIANQDVADHGWTRNAYFEGIKMAGFDFAESFSHVGLHTIDMDAEASEVAGGRIAFSGGIRCTDHPTVLDCSNVPFPKGAYISAVNVVGSVEAEVNDMTLNVAGIGCSMVNFTGIVDSSFRKAGEHSLRVMGWYRFSIMRNAFLGQHYEANKAKLTTRICADAQLFQGQYLNRDDLPSTWQDDVEGRTRNDTYTGTDDDYLHVSRYMVVNGNQLGDRDVFAIDENGASFGIGIHHSNPDDSIFAQTYIVSHNRIETESNDTSASRVELSGLHGTCVDNDYRFGTTCNAWHAFIVPNSLRINPQPINPPSAPGNPL